MASNTPNLNLLKKDPVVDATDTFNIETMLNENWDKLDQADGQNVKKEIGKGLSTEDYSTAEKSKLTGIADNANNYQHPATHNATIINQDSTHRFVTDAEKVNWNSAEQNAKNYTDTLLNDIKDLTPITLTVANWVDDVAISGCYYYQITDATVTANTVIDVYFDLSTTAIYEALQDLQVRVKSYAGYWRIYAVNLAIQDFTINGIVKH